MSWAILTSKGKRAKDLLGNLTPVFENVTQAERCIVKRCGSSKLLKIVRV